MQAMPLTVISSMATRELVAELAALYQTVTAQSVVTEAAGGVDVAKRVMAGEVFDVVILAGNAIDKLVADGRLQAGSRIDLVRSGIAIAVKGGAPQPDIASEEAVRAAVSGARTVSYSTGPSGVYLEKMFERWGILEAIRPRILVPPPGVPVGSLVAAGTAELGFQQLSELLNCPGVDVVGALPSAIQSITVFSGGIAAGSSRPGPARALLQFMASPAVAEVKRRFGMEGA